MIGGGGGGQRGSALKDVSTVGCILDNARAAGRRWTGRYRHSHAALKSISRHVDVLDYLEDISLQKRYAHYTGYTYSAAV